MMIPGMMIPPWPEDPYGRVKRLTFVSSVWHPTCTRVLDVGCGTGSQLTLPLAQHYATAQFIGVDSDAASLDEGRATHPPANLQFYHPDDLDPDLRFDLIIASEVLEHVDDPAGFLTWMRSRLSPDGRILLTVPNGYGPSEAAQLVEALATLSGVWPVLRWLKRRLIGGGQSTNVDTLAVSPHVNFYSRSDLHHLFTQAGLDISTHANRTFLCGFLLDQIISAFGLTGWNARIADHLPAWAVSDWMMVLRPAHPPLPSTWKRTFFGSFRRRINLRRWGITP